MSEELKQKLLELARTWKAYNASYYAGEYEAGYEAATRSCGEELEELLTEE